jgi:HD-like signal output (HDOD) protein
MQCAACAETVPENSRFCNHCGTRLPIAQAKTAVKPAQIEVAVKAALSPRTARNPERKPPVLLSRAQRVQQVLTRILESPDLPAFSHHIRGLMGLLGTDDMSLRRLTNIVLNDYGLTVTLMRTANSFHYNRSGKPIRSITHAITMLGIDAIRHLASSLLFLEHYRNKAVGLTELLLLSTLTASHTRHLARRVLPGRVEEAHLCGMLRNLGEVLVACYLPDEYAKILAKMKQRNWTEKEAAVSVIGFSYEELGQAMARHWKLPESVSDTIGADHPGALKDDTLLGDLVSFSHSLTGIVYRGSPEAAKQRLKSLVAAYKGIPGMQQERVAELLDAAISDTRDTFCTLKMPLDHLQLQQQTDLALARIESAERKSEETTEPAAPSASALAEDLETELRSSIEHDAQLDLNSAMMMVLEGIFRGGLFERVLLCLVTTDRKRIRGRLGLGGGIDELAELFDLPFVAGEDALVDALLERQDAFVLEPGQENSEFLRGASPACYGLFPIVVNEIVVGGIYFDRTTSVPSPTPLPLISRLRDLAALAISRSRTEMDQKNSIR